MMCDGDDCQEEYRHTTEDSFQRFVNEAKTRGWKIVRERVCLGSKQGTTWEHYCPNCEIPK